MSDLLLPANELFTPLESIPQNPVNTPGGGQSDSEFSKQINSIFGLLNVNPAGNASVSRTAGTLPSNPDGDQDLSRDLPLDGKVLPFPFSQVARLVEPVPAQGVGQPVNAGTGLQNNPENNPGGIRPADTRLPHTPAIAPAALPGLTQAGSDALSAIAADPLPSSVAPADSGQDAGSATNLLEMLRNSLTLANRPVLPGGVEQGADGKGTDPVNLSTVLPIVQQDSLPANDPQLRIQLATAVKDQVQAVSQHLLSGSHDFSHHQGNDTFQGHQGVHTQMNVERGQFVLQNRPADTYMLQTNVQKQEWASELGNRVSMMARDGLEVAHLRLNPANLGTLEVRISVQNDQAQVHFLSQHAHVRDALEASLPRLREMMQDGGLSLADVDISDQSPAREQDNNARGFPRNAGILSGTLAEAEVLPQIVDMNLHNPRGVDYYV